MANRNFLSQKMYQMRGMPVLADLNFIVTPTNANGITSLSGPLVTSVLMYSTAGSPTAIIAAGVIKIKLDDNYNAMLNGVKAMIQCANTGSDVKIDNSAMTAGVPYTITTLGNASAAKWLAIGVPAGVTPAVGVSFIATSNGGAGNVLTSRVQAAIASSAIASIDVMPNPSVSPSPDHKGSEIILICRDFAGAIAAPDTGSKISIQLLMNNSSVTGE